MKKILFGFAMLSVLSMSSCQDEKNLYKERPFEGNEVNTSLFSTSHTVQVSIDYSNANAKALFYVYDKNPLTIGENNTISFDESIKPLDAAWTDSKGQFTGTMTLPNYVSDVYIVSGAYYVPTLMTGKISNGTLTVSSQTTRAAGDNSTYNKDRFNNLGWSTVLGTFDKGNKSATGEINYAYTGTNEKLKLSAEEVSTMQTTVYSVLDVKGTCPQEYRTDNGDLYVVKDDTEIVLTALGGNTCWNSSLGYYYYKEDAIPTSMKDVKVYTVFPNCQSGWADRGQKYEYPIGLEVGTAVQLKYFDDANPNGTVKFPKGYRVGFVLACNSWDTYFSSYSSINPFMSSSTKAFNTPMSGVVKSRTAMFRKGDITALAFEDHKDDQNYTDVIFALKSEPALSDVPVIDEEYNTTVSNGGVYAFEDLWPAAGDYDMNDVMAEYTYTKTFTPKNILLQESFEFQTFANKADLNNGLAFILKSLSGYTVVEDSVKYAGESNYAPTTFVRNTEGNNIIVRFTENVKAEMNATYKVTVKYDETTAKTKQTYMDAFIYRPGIEVHCPMLPPTSAANSLYFGTKDDRSDLEKGIYYVSDKENIYPFAFYLSGAKISDVEVLLEPKNETTPISELYPGFVGWAKNNETNTDWYKK